MQANKLHLNTDIYSESNIRKTCGVYKDYARIKIRSRKQYVELTFDKCKYEPSITMKEFENYLINIENMK